METIDVSFKEQNQTLIKVDINTCWLVMCDKLLGTRDAVVKKALLL